MDVRYEIVGDSAVFLLENLNSERSLRRNVSFAGVATDEASMHRLLDAVWRHSRSQALASQENFIRGFLKPFMALFRERKQLLRTNGNSLERLGDIHPIRALAMSSGQTHSGLSRILRNSTFMGSPPWTCSASNPSIRRLSVSSSITIDIMRLFTMWII